MAAALCLNAAPEPVLTPGSNRVAVVARGAFGRHVASLLSTAGQDIAGPCRDEVGDVFETGPDLVLVALWRPHPGLCDYADEAAHRTGIPWLPVIVEHPVIRVGPWVQPSLGPCFRCYQRRRESHDQHHATTAALRAAYDADPDCGPRGYLPHHARLAAAAARALLQRHRAFPGSPAGTVTTIRMTRPSATSSAVIGCHDCERCAPRDGGVVR